MSWRVDSLETGVVAYSRAGRLYGYRDRLLGQKGGAT
jgi:hypothetical protein